VTKSNRRRRSQVHGQLTDLLGPGGDLEACPNDVTEFFTDELRDQVNVEYKSQDLDVETEGKAVIITAGPPGAGKSSALGSLLDGHRRIDPDEIKDLLLQRLEDGGLLEFRHDHVLADEQPLMPGELAWWVHDAANLIAQDVRADALAAGENFAMEGTLEWIGLAGEYAGELAERDYESLTILDVEVPRGVAIEQAKERWWTRRHDGSPCGGRFMPDRSFDRYYPVRASVSITATRARTLFADALDSGVEARIICLSRDAVGNEHTAVVEADGTIGRWPTSGAYRDKPKGAVCIECGRPLRSDESIARGTGRHCTGSI
jgi:hypothetical protein